MNTVMTFGYTWIKKGMDCTSEDMCVTLREMFFPFPVQRNDLDQKEPEPLAVF